MVCCCVGVVVWFVAVWGIGIVCGLLLCGGSCVVCCCVGVVVWFVAVWG